MASSGLAGSTVNTNELDLIPEDHSLWTESMLWDKDIVVRTGLGYKDNVLLSSSGAQGSGFFTSGLDLSIFRLPLDGWDLKFSIVGDDERYFHNPGGLKGEDLFLSSLQVQKYFKGFWRAGLEVRGVYADQVIEALLEIGGVTPIQAIGGNAGVRPFVRRDLGTNWWVQLEGDAAREWWDFPLDNYWKFGGQVALGLDYGKHSHISLSYGGFYLPHDYWQARDAEGNQLVGTKLAIRRQDLELKWEHDWDAAQHWATTTKLGWQRDEDNGGGFFNYDRYQLAEEIRFRTKDWELKGVAGLSYYGFPVQTIDIPPSPLLHLTTLDFELRIERRLYKSLRLFGSYAHEQAVSNDPFTEYKANVVTGGFSWEF